ncbi:uncharacterized protein J3D65DRAFT_342153 [Phyllosticta citribraziliensis]|uniref:Secreted protein n=1 Tax=Phyllosticta citribraziliensis TaxID=989973 RepID=A0ABR1LVL1_9PEZI
MAWVDWIFLAAPPIAGFHSFFLSSPRQVSLSPGQSHLTAKEANTPRHDEALFPFLPFSGHATCSGLALTWMHQGARLLHGLDALPFDFWRQTYPHCQRRPLQPLPPPIPSTHAAARSLRDTLAPTDCISSFTSNTHAALSRRTIPQAHITAVLYHVPTTTTRRSVESHRSASLLMCRKPCVSCFVPGRISLALPVGYLT